MSLSAPAQWTVFFSLWMTRNMSWWLKKPCWCWQLPQECELWDMLIGCSFKLVWGKTVFFSHSISKWPDSSLLGVSWAAPAVISGNPFLFFLKFFSMMSQCLQVTLSIHQLGDLLSISDSFIITHPGTSLLGRSVAFWPDSTKMSGPKK